MPRRVTTCSLLCAVAFGLYVRSAAAQGPAGFVESFESPTASWRDVGGNVRYRVEVHERAGVGAHSGASCEYVQLTAGANGRTIYLSHDAGNAPIIAELRPSVWLRSDRSGIELAARVVLPRTLEPNTRQPVTTLVAGTRYTQAGDWQKLEVADVPTLLERQTRILRAQLRSDVDTREAYIDRLLLNVYAGEGRTQVWIDDLEIAGYVPPPGRDGFALASNSARGPIAPADFKRTTIELNGTVLLADGRPIFPRIIEHRGETLAFLRERGFNTVRVAATPTPEMLAEASRLGLWLVAPPPRPAGLETPAGPPTPLAELGPEFGPILAWDLGRGLTSRDLEISRRWADQLRRADSQRARPLTCSAATDVRSYSRIVDLMCFQRTTLATSFELADYGTWLREMARLTRPGTPLWTTVDTQPAVELREQATMLAPGSPSEIELDADQIRLVVYTALAGGARGICFASRTPLDSSDRATRARAAALELMNLELSLVEPWLAGGSVVENIQGVSGQPPGTPAQPVAPQDRAKVQVEGQLQVALPDVHGVVLQTDKARLLMPLWSPRGGQFVPTAAAGNNVVFVVPGVPESIEVYEVTPGGLRPLRCQRTKGGLRVSLDELGMTTQVVMTQDGLVVNSLTRRLAETSRRAADLQRELALERFQFVAAIDQQLAMIGHPAPNSAEALQRARAALQASDASLATGDVRSAYVNARRALRPLHTLARAHWQQAAKALGSPIVGPLALTFGTLTDHWQFVETLRAARWGANQLAEGQFEDLNAMQAAGWQHFQHAPDGVHTDAELSPAARHTGALSLRLAARATNEQAAGGLIESAPVWITSPSVPATAGQWFRISGWVYVPEPVGGSIDGLLIMDSLGGEALAERIGETAAWQPFTLVRAAPRAGPLSVTIALTGLGEAWIDDVAITPLLARDASASPPAELPAPATGQRPPQFQVPIPR